MSLLIGLLLILLSILSYYKRDNLSLSAKALLIFLRSSAFLILLFILLNPYFKGLEQIREKSRVLLLIDNSSSMNISKGEYTGGESVKEAIKLLNIDSNEEAVFDTYLIGRDVRQSTVDSLSFNETETNLFDAYQLIKDSEFDATAAILVSDGIYTIGRDPLFSVSDINIPVYTVAAGDSSRVNDLIITDVQTPEIAYLNAVQPIEVSIRNSGFEGQKSTLTISSDGREIENVSVSFDKNESIQTIPFELFIDQEGLNTLEIRLQELDAEWNSDNNLRTVSVDVQDSKLKILDLTFEIHPDVGSIRNVLKSDQNIELMTRTWVNNQRFLESNQMPPADSIDLIVLHGLPQSTFNKNLLDNYSSEVPLILFQKPIGIDLQSGSAYQDYTLIEGFSSISEIGLYPAADTDEHPILELPELNYDELEFLRAPFRNQTLNPGSRSLFNVQFQKLKTNQPLIVINEGLDLRQIHVNAFDWYRLAQSSNRSVREWFQALINNMISWTSDKPDNRRLKIETSNLSVNEGDNVVIRAFLKNESGEIEEDGRIDVEITSPDGETRSYSMENKGLGNYLLQIASGEEGYYRFSATARKGNRIIDTLEGNFMVNPSNSELINTIRNDELLIQTASLTGAKHYQMNGLDSLLIDMNRAGLFKSEQSQREVYAFWVQHPLWFILVIALLAGEWLIRKFYSLP